MWVKVKAIGGEIQTAELERNDWGHLSKLTGEIEYFCVPLFSPTVEVFYLSGEKKCKYHLLCPELVFVLKYSCIFMFALC